MTGSDDRPLARLYSPFFPFPPTEGGRWVVAEQARALAGLGWRVELVSWLDPMETLRAAARSAVPAELEGRLTIRHLGDPRAEAPSVAAWQGEMDVAEPFRRGGRNSESGARRALRVVRSLASPHASPELFHYPPSADLRHRLRPADLGVYHYTFAHSWLSGERSAPERRVAVHVHNRESVIAAARAATSSGITRRLHLRNARLLARHERALASSVDELWFVSRADLEAWREDAPGDTLRFVPPTLPDLRGRAPARGDGDREIVLGFVGSLDFEPNLRGLEWLVRVLAPELARLPRVPRVVIAGRGVPENLRREGERWGFFDFRGFVDDLEPFWAELTGFLVPDLHGIGVRIKLLEALARGLPTLTHPSAAAPLAPDVAASPLLEVHGELGGWRTAIARLGERAPPRERPPSLEGRTVYRFLATTG